MNEEENQRNPLAPARLYGRSDEEFAPKAALPPPPLPHKEHGTGKCCVYVLLWLVVQAAIALIVAMVVFRVETPRLRLADVAVQSLHHAISTLPPSLNATLAANVTVKNTNFGSFRFDNGSSISVVYAGHPVGDMVPIGAGRARARHTEKVTSATIQVESGRLEPDVATKNLSGDLSSGTVRLSTYASLRGRIRVWGIVRRRTSEMNCTITLNLNSSTIQDVRCR
ncbi:hypothetical protein SAY86_027351 [Trapa natans]|uniref:Late embryogenesis abundant protein LEA-2 subgroup domain-containing protein n=1 Tax=Trapa natans TaxID=22666 RepID=A0AAN7QJ63_TRANT|nr:hypothetical protein SAY86_027351 [Trapa natans]